MKHRDEDLKDLTPAFCLDLLLRRILCICLQASGIEFSLPLRPGAKVFECIWPKGTQCGVNKIPEIDGTTRITRFQTAGFLNAKLDVSEV